ncbi:MAG: acetyl-CoA carboxylase biotin carboxyl carrier protein subunit, partial [Longimicrobiales bacterium]
RSRAPPPRQHPKRRGHHSALPTIHSLTTGDIMALREIKSEITGSLWKLLKNVGDQVDEDEPIMVLESMKMEIPVLADAAGVVRDVRVIEGAAVAEGQVVAVIEV